MCNSLNEKLLRQFIVKNKMFVNSFTPVFQILPLRSILYRFKVLRYYYRMVCLVLRASVYTIYTAYIIFLILNTRKLLLHLLCLSSSINAYRLDIVTFGQRILREL